MVLEQEIVIVDMSKATKCLEAFSKYTNNIVFWGTNDSKSIKQHNEYYFIDMPYFDKLRSHFNEPGKEYWRICKNCLQINTIQNTDETRFKSFNININDWNDKGNKIVVLPSSGSVEYYYNQSNWLSQTLDTIKKYTNRPIIIRRKGPSMGLIHKKPLYEDIKDAHAVITLTSIAGIEAARLGIPVFCHEQSAAAPIGLHDLSKIESPIYPDRTKWLNSLANNVFTLEEIRNGTFKEFVKWA